MRYLPSSFRMCLLAATLLLMARAAHAQLCEGGASFKGAPVQVGLGTAFTSKSHGVGALVGGGTDAIWAIATVARRYIDNVDNSGRSIAVTVGTDRAAGRLHACPLFGIGGISGPRVPGVDTSSLNVGAGGSVGVVTGDPAHVAVIPTAALVV